MPGACAPGWLKSSSIAPSADATGAAVVDQRGRGKGTSYFSEEPRVFFLEVTSEDVEWKITVSERVR